MRSYLLTFLVSSTLACAAHSPSTPPPEESAPEAPVAPPELEPEPEPEPEPPPPPPSNADLNVSLRWADGKTKSGHVKRIERSSDWYGEKDWYDKDSRLVIPMEASNGDEIEPNWSELQTITIRPGKAANADCSYESDYIPWMYTCEVTNSSKAKLKNGKRYSVISRHRWRFTFDDDSQVEFWLYKHATRSQDSGDVEFGLDVSENYDLYQKLQADLRTDLKSLLISITIQ